MILDLIILFVLMLIVIVGKLMTIDFNAYYFLETAKMSHTFMVRIILLIMYGVIAKIFYRFCKNISIYFIPKFKIIKDVFLLIVFDRLLFLFIGMSKMIDTFYGINVYYYSLKEIFSILFIIFFSFFIYNVYNRKEKSLYIAMIISSIFVLIIDFFISKNITKYKDFAKADNVIFTILDIVIPLLFAIYINTTTFFVNENKMSKDKIKINVIKNVVASILSIALIGVFVVNITTINFLDDITSLATTKKAMLKNDIADNLKSGLNKDSVEQNESKLKNGTTNNLEININQNNSINDSIVEENNISIKDVIYDNIKVGDVINFGEYRYQEKVHPHEWIVLDKRDRDKAIMLLSKGGQGTENISVTYEKALNYKNFNYNTSDDYKYDLSYDDLKDELSYKYSALRYEFFQTYRWFNEIYLSKEEDDKYNQYRFKDNILKTHIDDTDTDDYFFPLSKAEYNKYKKIKGVGDYYRRIDNIDIIYAEGQEVVWVLRDIENGGESKAEYSSFSIDKEFVCVDTGLTYTNFEFEEMNDYKIKKSNRKKGVISNFLKKFPYAGWKPEWERNLLVFDIRPAMWYKCEK